MPDVSEYYRVFYKGSEMAIVTRTNDKYICSCNQLMDLGTACCHILSIEGFDISLYTQDIWKIRYHQSQVYLLFNNIK